MEGPPPKEAIDRTVQWAERAFAAYYGASEPWLPPRFGRREFGFMWLAQKFFLRHTGVRTSDDLAALLAQRAPAHVYYSVAYYRKPDAPTMREKEWLGADLVFDLDADHLPEVRAGKDMGFEEQLAAVKREAQKLLHDFVLGDFGFAPENVRVVFSGGRGYHIHVDDPRVHPLQGSERREIVDYVTKLGLDVTVFRREIVTKRNDFGKHVTKQSTVLYPPAASPDWGGRVTRAAVREMRALLEMPPTEAKKKLMERKGVGPKRAEEFLAALSRPGTRILEEAEQGNFTIPVDILGEEALVEMQVHAVNDDRGEADEPVTADVKRLIRLPGSIHGKTGLRVTPVPIDEFAAFDPLCDALAFGEEPTEVVVSKPERVRFGDVDYVVEPGRQTLPMRVALFLVLRRKALLPY